MAIKEVKEAQAIAIPEEGWGRRGEEWSVPRDFMITSWGYKLGRDLIGVKSFN
ncbi:hypothetical protein AM10699_14640 [Acaryochloris marina MBIC10699]|nr:hypothetical protein AM10699_14640 [Acaryochloris marina MBIC10699]